MYGNIPALTLRGSYGITELYKFYRKDTMKINIRKTLLAALSLPVLALGVLSIAPATTASADELTLKNGPESSRGESTPGDLFGENGVFRTITNVLLFLIGAISVIMLIVGGIRFTTSSGDSSAVQSAKNTIFYAIIGIVVAILAYAVVTFVIGAFATSS